MRLNLIPVIGCTLASVRPSWNHAQSARWLTQHSFLIVEFDQKIRQKTRKLDLSIVRKTCFLPLIAPQGVWGGCGGSRPGRCAHSGKAGSNFDMCSNIFGQKCIFFWAQLETTQLETRTIRNECHVLISPCLPGICSQDLDKSLIRIHSESYSGSSWMTFFISQ